MKIKDPFKKASLSLPNEIDFLWIREQLGKFQPSFELKVRVIELRGYSVGNHPLLTYLSGIQLLVQEGMLLTQVTLVKK